MAGSAVDGWDTGGGGAGVGGSAAVFRVGVARRVGGGGSAGEHSGEEAGERGFEHGEAGADDASVGFDGGPEGGVEGAEGLVFEFGAGVEGCHAED